LITFDDGPNPETTPLILKALDKQKIKALFFCVGSNVEEFPELAKEILDRGHEIGNHTFSHKVITRIGKQELNDEIDLFNTVMIKKFNYRIKYFRPPYGRFNLQVNKILYEKKMETIMWSLLTYDYKNNLNLVGSSIVKYLKRNSIIVLHDSIKSKGIILDSIDIITREVDRHNYETGEPAECLK
jgi:peptidoglycan/xylan/chitin deacetylase (PgdA/CDA1 family)